MGTRADRVRSLTLELAAGLEALVIAASEDRPRPWSYSNADAARRGVQRRLAERDRLVADELRRIAAQATAVAQLLDTCWESDAATVRTDQGERAPARRVMPDRQS